MAKIRLENLAAGLFQGGANFLQGVAQARREDEAREERKRQEKKADALRDQTRTDQQNAATAAAFGQWLQQYATPPAEAFQRKADIATGKFQPKPGPHVSGNLLPPESEYYDAAGPQMKPPSMQSWAEGLPNLGPTVTERTAQLAEEADKRKQAAENLRFQNQLKRDALLAKQREDLEKKRDLARMDLERLRQNPRLAKDKSDYVFRNLKGFYDLGGSPEFADEERQKAAAEYDAFMLGGGGSTRPVPTGPAPARPFRLQFPGQDIVEQFSRDTAGGLPAPFAGRSLQLGPLSLQVPAPSPAGPMPSAPPLPMEAAPAMPSPAPPRPNAGPPPVPVMPMMPAGAPEPAPVDVPPIPSTAPQRFPLGTAAQAKIQGDLARAYAAEKAGDLAAVRAEDIPKAAEDRRERTTAEVAHKRNQDEVALARQALDEKEFDHKVWHDKAKLALDRLELDARRQEWAMRKKAATDPAQKMLYTEWTRLLTQINILESKYFTMKSGRAQRQAVAVEIQKKLEGLYERADELKAGILGGKPVPGKQQSEKELKAQYPGMDRYAPADIKKQVAIEAQEFERRMSRKPTAAERNELSRRVREKLKVPPSGQGGY